ncbi:9830_t:CDS:2 [Dentiscutata erythropus]|uniref:9830_t:CDS:1 n=1 Tax=Dentiscutata erythropus TaxID=1348616 RepID=A0A9N8W0M1_9GLOM|nr:9830_t:CDS:2 [Dentiscutata erythropus]
MNNDDILTNRPDKSSHKTRIMEKLEKYNPSLVLENKASVARDHLANERTFLAWLRMSLSFISIGIAITQSILKLDSNKDDEASKRLGIAFIGFGIIFLGLGLFRYFNFQKLMTQDCFSNSIDRSDLDNRETVLTDSTDNGVVWWW